MKHKQIDDYKIILYTDDIIGKIFNGKYGEYKVLGATNKKSHSNILFACVFIKTGYINTFRKQSILEGSVKDPYYPSICNIACYGIVNSNHFLYKRWSDIIHRCYNVKDNDYEFYGKCGIIVTERWLCFENFVKDASFIKGYDEYKIKKGLLEIDKDNSNKRVYSLEVCEWIPRNYNTYLANINQINNLRAFVAENKSINVVIYSKNISKFAREYGLDKGNISKCLLGKYKQHKGWSFKYMEEAEMVEV